MDYEFPQVLRDVSRPLVYVWGGTGQDPAGGVVRHLVDTLRGASAQSRRDDFSPELRYEEWQGGPEMFGFPPKKYKPSNTEGGPKEAGDQSRRSSVSGLVKHGWVEKHLHVLPSVLIVVTQFNVDWSAQEWNKRENELKKNIEFVRDPLQLRETRVIVVACRTGSRTRATHAEVMEERINGMKRHVGIDAKYIFVMTPEDNMPVSANAHKLQAMVKHLSDAYYEGHLKRYKTNERSVARGSNTALIIRYNFKAAVFTELTLPSVKAGKYYTQVLNTALGMITDRQFDEDMLGQLKFVLHVSCFKLCDLGMRAAAYESAAKCIDRVQQVMDHLIRIVEKPWRIMKWVSTLLTDFTNLMIKYKVESLGPGFDLALYYEDNLRMILKRMCSMSADCGTGDPSQPLVHIVGDFFPNTHLTTPLYAGGRPRLVDSTTGYFQLENQANAMELVRQYDDTQDRHAPLHQEVSMLLSSCLAVIPAGQCRRRAHLTELVGDRLMEAKDYTRAIQCYEHVLQSAGADKGWDGLVVASLGKARTCAESSEAWGMYLVTSLLMLGPYRNHYNDALLATLTRDVRLALTRQPGSAASLLGISVDSGMVAKTENPMESVPSGRRQLALVGDTARVLLETRIRYDSDAYGLGCTVCATVNLRNRLSEDMHVTALSAAFLHDMVVDVPLPEEGLVLPRDEWTAVHVTVVPPGRMLTDVPEACICLHTLSLTETVPSVGGRESGPARDLEVHWSVDCLSDAFKQICSQGTSPIDAVRLCAKSDCPVWVRVEKLKPSLTLDSQVMSDVHEQSRIPAKGTVTASPSAPSSSPEPQKIFADALQRVNVYFNTNDDTFRESRIKLTTNVVPGSVTSAVFWHPTDAAGSTFAPLATYPNAPGTTTSSAGQPSVYLRLPEAAAHTRICMPLFLRVNVVGELCISCEIRYIPRSELPVDASSSFVTTTFVTKVLVVKPLRFHFRIFPDNEFHCGNVLPDSTRTSHTGVGPLASPATPSSIGSPGSMVSGWDGADVDAGNLFESPSLVLAGSSGSLQASVTFLGQGFGSAAMGQVHVTGMQLLPAEPATGASGGVVLLQREVVELSGVQLAEAEVLSCEARYTTASHNTVMIHPASLAGTVSESPGVLVVDWAPAGSDLMQAPVSVGSGTWLPQLEPMEVGVKPLEDAQSIDSKCRSTFMLPRIKVVAAPYAVNMSVPTEGTVHVPFRVTVTVTSVLPTSSSVTLSSEPSHQLIRLGITGAKMQLGPYGTASVYVGFIPTCTGKINVPKITLVTSDGQKEVPVAACGPQKCKLPHIVVYPAPTAAQ